MRKVAKRYFKPVPKVDSAILKIKNISKKFFKGNMTEENFFALIRLGFRHKRKKLLGNLRPHYKNVDEMFKALNIDFGARAEDLSLKVWLNLAKLLK